MQWYVMTSATTDGDTKQHFEEHDFFGLQREQVVFFQQVRFPAMTHNDTHSADPGTNPKHASRAGYLALLWMEA